MAYMWASASPADPGCDCGYGGIWESVMDSDTQPMARARTRTLMFAYRNGPASSREKIPAGTVEIAAGITAWVEGEGWSSVRLPATVLSIAASA